MTVGQPETNLDTWGLRYVKKKKGDAMDLTGDAPTKSPQFGGGSELDLATANPSGRQNDSSGDTTGRYGGAGSGSPTTNKPTQGGRSGEKIGEQAHIHQQGQKDDVAGQKKQTFTTSGTSRGEGVTQGADTTPSGQGGAGQALTSGTRKNPPRESAGLEGSKQTHTGSEGYNYATNPPKSRGGHKIKPAKQGEGSSKKPSKYIQRAALDLAIIKCKLLKMNNIQKDFIEDNKPTRPQFRKEDDEVTQEEKTEASKQSIARQRESSKQDSEEKLGQHNFYKSEDVVDKAIELINMAYDEINKDAKDGKQGGKPKEPREIYAGDSSDPENWKKTKEPDTTQQSRASQELRGRIEDVGSANLPTADVRHTELGREGYNDSVVGHTKEEHIKPEDRPDKQGNRRSVAETNRPQQSDFSDTASSTSVTTDGQERDNKGQLTGKADGITTTGDVGAANLVYSDVKEAKKQKQ